MDGKLPELIAMPDRLVGFVKQMPLGLCHNDLARARRAGAATMENVCCWTRNPSDWRPVFRDIGPWLGLGDEFTPRSVPQEDAARYYLEAYGRAGGPTVGVEQFLKEATILAMAEALHMLWFRLERALDGKVDWTDDRDEGRRVYRADLARQLQMLFAMEDRLD